MITMTDNGNHNKKTRHQNPSARDGELLLQFLRISLRVGVWGSVRVSTQMTGGPSSLGQVGYPS
ncbi:hypothetical protein CCHR01_05636 [Colletotrichum chrysophilum]|uniref:Uncharacterized protein n=1 Tax=Colletotrichum chrysophilum TaxID=1836956 RepID=A0AAD9AU23_9PEZI|nr:hypothetical protein CCHR01_05636 [Colletotrichum chrysophilum]